MKVKVNGSLRFQEGASVLGESVSLCELKINIY